MPMHPAPPHDLHGLVEAYAQTVQAVADLGRSCRDADFELPTECPGWTVKDHISHVVGVESHLQGNPDPAIEVPDDDHVQSPFNAFMELGVQTRRDRPGADVVAELEHVIAQRLATLRSPGLSQTSTIPGVSRPAPAGELLQLRCMDIWTHEQDIRTALKRPGNLDSPAASVFVDALLAMLPELITSAGLQEGVAAIFDVTGPVVARSGVRMGTDPSGAVRGFAMFTGDSTGTIPIVKPGQAPPTPGPSTSISITTEALCRRAAGRRSVADTRYHVTGDDMVAEAALAAIAFTP